MRFPLITRRRAQTAVDVATAGLRHQLEQARAEAAKERGHRQRAAAHAVQLAERLDEVTAANQSYDVGP